MAEGSMPWQTTAKGDGADEHFKYQYHPGGDKNKPVKDAPSALHSVIVPNVTLTKVRVVPWLTATMWEMETNTNCRKIMIDSINMAKKAIRYPTKPQRRNIALL